MSRRQALLKIVYTVIAPFVIGISFILWRLERRAQQRELQRERQLRARIPTMIREGKITPTYVMGDLNWKPAAGVSNQVDADGSGQVHVITDESAFSYQILSEVLTGDAEICYIAFAIEVIRGGASVMVLDEKGKSLGSKNFDRVWKYRESLIVRIEQNNSLTMVVANNLPNKGQSEFRVLQFDVYCIPPATDIVNS